MLSLQREDRDDAGLTSLLSFETWLVGAYFTLFKSSKIPTVFQPPTASMFSMDRSNFNKLRFKEFGGNIRTTKLVDFHGLAYAVEYPCCSFLAIKSERTRSRRCISLQGFLRRLKHQFAIFPKKHLSKWVFVGVWMKPVVSIYVYRMKWCASLLMLVARAFE